jgi:uncharacterized membrane protein YdbT with pleckstrin-like domain
LTLVGPAIGMIIGLIIAIVLPTFAKEELEMLKDAFAYIGWIAFVFCAIPFIKQALINATTHLAVTNKRVVGKVGILKVDTIDYPVDKIDNVSYNASFFGNIFKFATVQIGSVSGEKKKIGAIGNAQEFKNKVTDAIEEHAAEARAAQAREIAAAMGK